MTDICETGGGMKAGIDLSPLDYDDPLALLEQAYDREGPKRVLLVVEWEQRRISAETRDPSAEGIPEYRWHGREDAYALDPLVDATALRQWVIDAILPAARPLFAAYEREWDGDNWVGTFPGHEEEKADFDALVDHIDAPRLTGGNAGIYRPEEWLVFPPHGFSPSSSDKDIAHLADEIVREARAENALVVGDVGAYLRGMRDAMRVPVPSPDRYDIEGYEVFERTAKPYGTGAYVSVPRGDIGKRFKVVRVDP